MLPSNLQPLFWDTAFEAIDSDVHKPYVISRILELGDESAVKWLENRYSPADLQSVVNRGRGLSAKSRNYWRIRYHLA